MKSFLGQVMPWYIVWGRQAHDVRPKSSQDCPIELNPRLGKEPQDWVIHDPASSWD